MTERWTPDELGDRTWGEGPADTDESSPEVERLTQEIDATRSGMSETLDELGQRLDPANLVAGAKETVREATVGKVESMATTAGDIVSDAGETARETGEGLIETIKRNPVPAAMAGIGLGWLWMNRDKGRKMTWPQTTGPRYSSVQAARFEPSFGDRVGEAGDEVSRRASSVASSVGEAASDVASRAKSTAGQVPDQIGEVGQEVGDTAQRLLDENPLAVGAIALAVGTAVGLALPATRTEQRVIGRAGSQLIDQAESALTKPMEELEDKMTETERKARTTA
ncbi:MAG TPA: DUF3618 domain-containing protein [Candidatus Limnocylindrales bacterium]|nr:DUF3618 domain-containing protein [Candidatus Limnocylindrales bacterium]